MPILKDEKGEAGKITKDDVVKGRAAAVVKIGTKFAEVRDADGKMILRAAAGLARAEHAQRRGCDGRVGGWLGQPGRPRSSQSSSQQLVIAGEAGRGPVSDGLNRWHSQRGSGPG